MAGPPAGEVGWQLRPNRFGPFLIALTVSWRITELGQLTGQSFLIFPLFGFSAILKQWLGGACQRAAIYMVPAAGIERYAPTDNTQLIEKVGTLKTQQPPYAPFRCTKSCTRNLKAE